MNKLRPTFLAVVMGTSLHLSGAEILPEGVYMTNCGYACAATCLVLHRMESDPDVLAERLGVGPGMERAVSLLDIKAALEAEGLGVVGLKDTQPPELLAILQRQPGLLAVVHLEQPGWEHFVVMVAMPAGQHSQLMVFNHPSPPRSKTPAQLLEGLDLMSGHLLLVGRHPERMKKVVQTVAELEVPQPVTASPAAQRPAPSASASRPAQAEGPARVRFLSDGDILVDPVRVAEVPSHAEEFSQPVLFQNFTNREIMLRSIVGSCSCFRGAEVPVAVGSGQSVAVPLKFGSRQFRSARGAEIIVQTDLENAKPIRLSVTLTQPASEAPPTPPLYVMRRYLHAGRLAPGQIAIERFAFPFLVERDQAALLEGLELAVLPSGLAAEFSPVEFTRINTREYARRNLLVRLSPGATGAFEHTLLVNTRHPLEKQLRLRVCGEVTGGTSLRVPPQGFEPWTK
ncbi:MAG: hypothetical protein AAGK14_02880 [Verrucomicrobiota bacterium]